MNKINLYLIFLMCMFSFFSKGQCTTVFGSGTCIPDSTNGCHVPVGTTCGNNNIPLVGCQIISCSSSCPPNGYYVPYGTLTAWSAFTSNMPSTMTVNPCGGGPGGSTTGPSTSSSSSSSTSCLPNGTICNTDFSLYPGVSSCTLNCCNPGATGQVACSGGTNGGADLGVCGGGSLGCPQPICSDGGGSCLPF